MGASERLQVQYFMIAACLRVRWFQTTPDCFINYYSCCSSAHTQLASWPADYYRLTGWLKPHITVPQNWCCTPTQICCCICKSEDYLCSLTVLFSFVALWCQPDLNEGSQLVCGLLANRWHRPAENIWAQVPPHQSCWTQIRRRNKLGLVLTKLK